ncbi:hypothetical protein ACH4C6_21765 [Streptomyces sp. NPDC017943]|uniref:hypothetical protein n=1 Tax=Streptomyces sp. NPDC017943 TaxID=3365019 RepID=UPI00379B41AB
MTTSAAACTVLALTLGVAVAYSLGWWARGRYDTGRRAEHDARPPGPHAIADEIALGWQELAEACCLRSWESGGRDDEHDPATCTRKDQTT